MKKFISAIALLLVITSCSSEDSMEREVERPVEEFEVIEVSVPDEKAGNVSLFEPEKIQEGLVLVNDASGNRVFLMDKLESKILKEWHVPVGIGNDAVLLENGNLLVALLDENPAFEFGGYGGRMAIIDPDGRVLWDFEYSDQDNLSHHDLEMLPNGNIIFLAWERKKAADLSAVGYNGGDEELFVEKILEVDPSNNTIVWEWNSWDHLIQDQDQVLDNFGVVSDNPGKIDINYKDHLKEGSYNGDIMHANALEYDEVNDVIYLSVNFFSEVWVIDHSTTTNQARTSRGGQFNKGGDLIYRFGNPLAYQNTAGNRLFYHNHNPTLVEATNRILVFSNGIPKNDPHSTVFELELPDSFNLNPDVNNEPVVFWRYEHEELFSAKVSGAHRLPNGNTLITEGTSGYWEVTNNKEIVWRFEGEGFYWRGYHYDLDSPAILNLNL